MYLDLPTHTAKRYVQPLREGGSLPAVVDTDGGSFVVKFRGAGQGPKALIAELIVGMLARELYLPVPDLAIIDVPPAFGRSEPDPEIQDLLRGSHGVNVGLRYLDGAFNFELPAAGDLISAEFAARLVWLDAYVTNPDRTHRNPNLLVWRRRPWLIDHGAALYAHHDWASADSARTRTPFPLIKDHVLLAVSDPIEEVDGESAERLGGTVLEEILQRVPDALFAAAGNGREFASPDEGRGRYIRYLRERLAWPRGFVAEASAAREAQRSADRRPLSARR
jgi:hypothetical protein